MLLFPHGDRSWSYDIPKQAREQPDADNEDMAEDFYTNEKYVTQREYFAYRVHIRKPQEEILFMAGKPFQEYLVDAWATTEQSRLYYIRNNQQLLRTDYYRGLMDRMGADGENTNLTDMGKRFILPSSHTGSARAMYQLYQDSMAIARFFHKVDYFITMTANPNWQEIKDALPRG